MRVRSRVVACLVSVFMVLALAFVGAGSAAADQSKSISGTSPDGGASFSGTLTWTGRGSFKADITLKDAKCDGNPVYFYFIINKGWTTEWQGKRRDNTEGCGKSITWKGIAGSDSNGIFGPTLRVCTDIRPGVDSCKEYAYDNPYFP